MTLKEWAKKLKRDVPAVFLALKDRETPLLAKITAAVTAIAGILIIFNSFKTAVTATRVIGAALVVCGVEIFYETYETAKKRREGKLIDDNGYIEVDFKDVDK